VQGFGKGTGLGHDTAPGLSADAAMMAAGRFIGLGKIAIFCR